MPDPEGYSESELVKAKAIYDKVYEATSKGKKPIPLSKVQSAFNLDSHTYRNIIDVFSKAHVFDIRSDRIWDVIPPAGLIEYETIEEGKVVSEEEFDWRNLKFVVKVLDLPGENVLTYYVPPIKISNGLKIQLKYVFHNLIRVKGDYTAPIGQDHEQKMEMAKRMAVIAIKKELKLPADVTDRLSDILLYEFSEIGCLSIFLMDPEVEEVVFNGNNAVSIYHCRHGWMKTNAYPNGEESLIEIANRMARVARKEINISNPIVETRLHTGDRVTTLLNTVSPQGTMITIRKFSRNPWTIVGLMTEYASVSLEIAALLWFAVEYDLNILVAGGSGSGKTTLLNAICSLIPPSIHTLSIESVREIFIPENRAWNWLSLTSRDDPNTDPIDTIDLINTSLKMRPERIILGEAVRPEEIRALFQAMQIGHPVYSTIHATSSNELMKRLMDPSYNIPKTDINSLDLVVVMYHNLKDMSRTLIEVSEITYDGSMSDSNIMSNLYLYSPKNRAYIQVSKPDKIFEKVNKKTGMTEAEMKADIEEKKKVLKHAIEKDIKGINEFGMFVQEYYSERENLLERVKDRR
ncbi:MAG: hypothetical protein GF416_02785 [Candidatus Altiarchaeales archaeon]|nr:hypothetical protein [Candidatus Altiarchaeales archaeon]MBD3416045.1 hypothetical protein [Candidatus Altiarchaeales archaeon]